MKVKLGCLHAFRKHAGSESGSEINGKAESGKNNFGSTTLVNCSDGGPIDFLAISRIFQLANQDSTDNVPVLHGRTDSLTNYGT
jgi:hypothetical protein